ncbi:MAG: hypothetical protein ABEJ40_03585 [Haloarculaceae archaeon]
MRQHRCPDCGVTLADVEFDTTRGGTPRVATGEKRDGLLGTLGVDERREVTTVMCPECGLIRHYAAVEE